MRKSGKIGIALACSAWLWTGAAATDGFQLNEVVVTATRSEEQAFKANANVSVVSKEKLEKHHYTNLQDALRDVPGVTIAGYGNTGEVYSANSLILNGSDKVVVLIDGVRANINGSSSTYGKMATAEISNLHNIERVEVVKSSDSALWGADAAGGIINIITRKPENNTSQTTLQAIRGSFAKEQYYLGHSGSKDGWYWDVSLQKKIAGDFKDGWGRKVPEHLNSVNNSLVFGKNWGSGDISIHYLTYRSAYLRPTGGMDTIPSNYALHHFNTGKKENSRMYLLYRDTLGHGWSHVLNIYRNKHRANETTWAKPVDPKSAQKPYIYHFTSEGFSEQLTWTGERHVVVGGLDWSKDKVDHYYTGPTSEFGGKKTVNTSLYVHDEWQAAEDWKIGYGLRWHHNSNYGTKWIPSVVVGYSPTEDDNYYVGYKRFFVPPYPSQLYGKYGVETLKPEEGYAIEGGWNHIWNRTTNGSVHFFYRDMKDSIAYNSGIQKYENTGREKGHGVEFRVAKQWGDKWSAQAAYTYIHLKPSSAKANPNSDGRIPRSTWNIGVQYAHGKWQSDLSVRAAIGKEGAKSQAVNRTAAAANYHSYWVLDWGLNYQADEHTSVFAKVRNILDRLYTEQRYILDPNAAWYSAPGRNFELGVEYRF